MCMSAVSKQRGGAEFGTRKVILEHIGVVVNHTFAYEACVRECNMHVCVSVYVYERRSKQRGGAKIGPRKVVSEHVFMGINHTFAYEACADVSHIFLPYKMHTYTHKYIITHIHTKLHTYIHKLIIYMQHSGCLLGKRAHHDMGI
jgi:hypothetical protein